MKPDTSHWREESAYEYMNNLSVEDLAWECLRRNSAYQADFRRQLRLEGDESERNLAISRHWGLRFRRSAESLQP